MKARLSILLIGALAALAPAISAQRSVTYSKSAPSVSSAYFRGGYGGNGGYETSRVWVPGHYETVSKRVFVPGPVKREWVAPVYEWRWGSCGLRYVCVRSGYWRSVQLPGHYEIRQERVYEPGRWVARGTCD